MAGLLDIFGTGGADTMGLLGMSPADIQRNRDDAQAQALYALAGRLFQGGNTGQSIAEGLQRGQQAYKGNMQEALQTQLQNTQLQELLKKRQEEQIAKQLFMRGYQPAVAGVQAKPVEEEGRYLGETPAVATQPARFDISKVAPELIAMGGTGQAYLKNALDLQQAMAGKTQALAEGATLVRENPLTGKVETIATGQPKKEDIAGDVKEARQILGITTPVNEMSVTERALIKAYIDRKDANKSPKVAVDLKDPTAVAKAQSDVIKDWRGVVKDTGAMEVADRFKAAKSAVEEANSGNKAADGALIYAIGKIYDPSGAVQEGDKQTILGNRSIPQSIKASAQKAFNGQSLLPEERAGLLAVAGKLVEAKARNLEAQKAPYSSISQQLGGNGSLLLNPLAEALTAPINEVPSMADIAKAAQAELARRKKL